MSKAKRFKSSVDSEPQNYRTAQIEFVSAEISGVPFCEHGPTILLERPRNGKLERFYACAVCRSRKDCSFYRLFDAERRHPTTAEKIRIMKKAMKAQRKYSHKELYGRLKSYRKISVERRLFCSKCSLLLLNANEAKNHNGGMDSEIEHQIINGISNKQIREPSTLLKLLDSDKKEAQFMFSRDTLSFLGDKVITKIGFNGVICLGAPRLHEFLNKAPYRKLCRSFLLDIDYRYAQFWSPRFFAQFNMFNGYFYTPLGEKCFGRFLNEVDKILVVVDPPYGGLVTPLAQTLQSMKAQIEQDGTKTCEIIFVSPYFMEQKICNAIPGMKMLDYKVTYEGDKFSTPDGGSYVRIFTTLDPSSVELPANFGYRYCKKCRRYVSSENRHCEICQACTSKDGRRFVHCKKCGKCVKKRYKHCERCDHCHKLPFDGSGCRQAEIFCQLCRQAGHVWINCQAGNDSDVVHAKKKKGDSTINGKQKNGKAILATKKKSKVKRARKEISGEDKIAKRKTVKRKFEN